MKNYLRKWAAWGIVCAMLSGAVPCSVLAADDTAKTVEVAASVTDGTSFLFFDSNLTVAANEAESFGFSDTVTDGVSAMDVLVKMHEEKYGDGFTQQTASGYLAINDSGWITTAFEKDGSTAGYAVNRAYTPSLAQEMSDDDVFEFFFYQDTSYYMDYYTHTDDFTLFTGEETTLNANGWVYAFSYEELYEADGEYIELAYVNENGEISSPIENVAGDENGNMTVSFDTAGTYYITFTGTNSTDTPVIPSITKVTVYSVDDIIAKTTKTIQTSDLAYGSEWKVMGLARNGYLVPDSYYESVKEKTDELLENGKATDIERTIIALTAIGKTPDNRLFGKLASKDFTVTKGGLMSSIYGLLALDSGNYTIPEISDANDQNTREIMINDIIAHQIDNGGIAFSAQWGADVDTTAMAVQALAKYMKDNETVNTAVNKAMEYILGNIDTVPYDRCASLAQAVTAMAATGNEKTGEYVKEMLAYYDGNGGFLYDGKINDYTTTQAYYALAAYKRFADGKSSLYDMTDVYYEIESVTNGICTVYAPFMTDAKLICASYTDGLLTDVKTIEANLKSGSNKVENVPSCDKIMLWNGLDKMVPLCGVYSGEITE